MPLLTAINCDQPLFKEDAVLQLCIILHRCLYNSQSNQLRHLNIFEHSVTLLATALLIRSGSNNWSASNSESRYAFPNSQQPRWRCPHHHSVRSAVCHCFNGGWDHGMSGQSSCTTSHGEKLSRFDPLGHAWPQSVGK